MCGAGSAPDKHCGDTRAHSIDTSIQGRPAAMPKRGRAMAAAALAAAAGWPQPVGQRPRLAEAGSDDGSCAPPERLTATQGVASELVQLKRLPVALSAAAARGPCEVVAGRVDPLLLQWLQEDPHWAGLQQRVLEYSKRRKCCTKPAERATQLKYEETGFVSVRVPACARCNEMDLSKELLARNVLWLLRGPFWKQIRVGWFS